MPDITPTLDQDDLDKFIQWLKRHQVSYRDIFEQLVYFFERRQCQTPEDSAQETLYRVARNIDSGEMIENPQGYIYGFARNVLAECYRKQQQRQKKFTEIHAEKTAELPYQSGGEDEQTAILEKKLLHESLQKCLKTLPEADKKLLINYYTGQGSSKSQIKKRLAREFGLSREGLRTKKFYILKKLRECAQQYFKNFSAGLEYE